jgi:hypothetical protein
MKVPNIHHHSQLVRTLLPVVLVLALGLSCSAPQPLPTGVAYEYESAKDMLRKGRFDRVLEFSEGPAKASPPNAFTRRAQVLQVVVRSGLISGYKEIVEAFQEGADATKNPRFKGEYSRLRNDNLQYGSHLALGLAEVAHLMTETKSLDKEYTLDAPYPSTEGPLTLPELAKVSDGGWIEPDEQEAVVKDAQVKGIDDALADIVGGDRSKARTELSSGPVKIAGVDFGLYLGRQLLVAASLFDKKHGRDSQKVQILCGEADEAATIVADLLKENPDKEKQKALKKLQHDIKTALRVL